MLKEPIYDLEELNKFNQKDLKFEDKPKIDRKYFHKEKKLLNPISRLAYHNYKYGFNKYYSYNLNLYFKYIEIMELNKFYIDIYYNSWADEYKVQLIQRVDEGLKLYELKLFKSKNLNEFINYQYLNYLISDYNYRTFYTYKNYDNNQSFVDYFLNRSFAKKVINYKNTLFEFKNNDLVENFAKELNISLNYNFKINKFSYKNYFDFNKLLAYYLDIVYSKKYKNLNHQNKLDIIIDDLQDKFTQYEKDIIIKEFTKNNYELFRHFEICINQNDHRYITNYYGKKTSLYYDRSKRSKQSQKLKDIAKIYNATHDVEDEIELINNIYQDWD